MVMNGRGESVSVVMNERGERESIFTKMGIYIRGCVNAGMYFV